eukprot:TRINITY_DN395_c0_g1_i1.p1 TRINITY_DN395_c0_g1~~TRINITY_DN395_c0_g1_i1.p1  ORF type:complete len:733 (+),score=171.23 TRINITY_DN395_c0_g1_i1:612-2810(+)
MTSSLVSVTDCGNYTYEDPPNGRFSTVRPFFNNGGGTPPILLRASLNSSPDVAAARLGRSAPTVDSPLSRSFTEPLFRRLEMPAAYHSNWSQVNVQEMTPRLARSQISLMGQLEIASVLERVESGLATCRPPEPCDEGVGGTYFMVDSDGDRVGVFKPLDEEPFASPDQPPLSQHSCSTAQLTVSSVLKLASSSLSNPMSPSAGQQQHTTEGKVRLRKGIPPGGGAIREVAASLLDHGNFARVPATTLVKCSISTGFCRTRSRSGSRRDSSPSGFFSSSPAQSESPLATPCLVNQPVVKVGSLQKFVPDSQQAWDYGPSKFDTDQTHRIGLLDLRLLNTDRHGGNMLVVPREASSGEMEDELPFFGEAAWDHGETGDEDDDEEDERLCRIRSSLSSMSSSSGSSIHNCDLDLVPIDHSFCLPEVLGDDVWFEWLTWPQARQPFSEETLAYVRDLDPKKDTRILEALGFPRRTIRIVRLATEVIKRCALREGLTLYEIGLKFAHQDVGKKSQFELLFDSVYASKQSSSSLKKEIVPSPSSTLSSGSTSESPSTQTRIRIVHPEPRRPLQPQRLQPQPQQPQQHQQKRQQQQQQQQQEQQQRRKTKHASSSCETSPGVRSRMTLSPSAPCLRSATLRQLHKERERAEQEHAVSNVRLRGLSTSSSFNVAISLPSSPYLGTHRHHEHFHQHRHDHHYYGITPPPSPSSPSMNCSTSSFLSPISLSRPLICTITSF